MKHITPIEEEVAREAIEKFRLKNMLSNEEEDGKYNAEMEELVEEEEEVEESLEKEREIEAILI